MCRILPRGYFEDKERQERAELEYKAAELEKLKKEGTYTDGYAAGLKAALAICKAVSSHERSEQYSAFDYAGRCAERIQKLIEGA